MWSAEAVFPRRGHTMTQNVKAHSRISLVTVWAASAPLAAQAVAESPRLPLLDLAANEFRVLAAHTVTLAALSVRGQP